jgi:hypothetical protein
MTWDQNNSNDQSKKNEMGKAHNTCVGRRGAERVLVVKSEVNRCVENTGTDGRIILK